jgi:hypothetical protein
MTKDHSSRIVTAISDKSCSYQPPERLTVWSNDGRLVSF